MTAKHVIQQHKFEQTRIDLPHHAAAAAEDQDSLRRPSFRRRPSMPEVQLEQPKINMPKPEPSPSRSRADGSQADTAADEGRRSRPSFWPRSPRRL